MSEPSVASEAPISSPHPVVAAQAEPAGAARPVARHLSIRKSTGLTGLDSHLGGGLPPGTTLLCLAEPSNGPYVFCEQFAAAGMANGEQVIYYNLERPKDQSMHFIDEKISVEESTRLLEYFNCYSVRLRHLGQEVLDKLHIENHSPNITEHLPKLLLERNLQKPYRIVIESLTESIRSHGLPETMRMLEHVAGIVRATGGVAVALLEKGLFDSTVEHQAKHIVDGVFEFGVQRQGLGLYQFLSISKMVGVPDAAKLMLYKETERGLWVDSTQRVF